ncbi:MAG: GatB/YqeY domain-containing protein [Cyclobacteriaceae bacterium]|jgi:hypothetical protein
MSLKDQIDTDIKNAMLNKQKDDLRALRAIKSLILLAETEKGNKEELKDDVEIGILMKAAKQRKDSIRIYEDQGRHDLAQKEKAELIIIERYLPKQMTENEIEDELKNIIADTGAQGMKDMGKVMGQATKKLAGKAEGKKIAELTKKLLSS